MHERDMAHRMNGVGLVTHVLRHGFNELSPLIAGRCYFSMGGGKVSVDRTLSCLLFAAMN